MEKISQQKSNLEHDHIGTLENADVIQQLLDDNEEIQDDVVEISHQLMVSLQNFANISRKLHMLSEKTISDNLQNDEFENTTSMVHLIISHNILTFYQFLF